MIGLNTLQSTVERFYFHVSRVLLLAAGQIPESFNVASVGTRKRLCGAGKTGDHEEILILENPETSTPAPLYTGTATPRSWTPGSPQIAQIGLGPVGTRTLPPRDRASISSRSPGLCRNKITAPSKPAKNIPTRSKNRHDSSRLRARCMADRRAEPRELLPLTSFGHGVHMVQAWSACQRLSPARDQVAKRDGTGPLISTAPQPITLHDNHHCFED